MPIKSINVQWPATSDALIEPYPRIMDRPQACGAARAAARQSAIAPRGDSFLRRVSSDESTVHFSSPALNTSQYAIVGANYGVGLMWKATQRNCGAVMHVGANEITDIRSFGFDSSYVNFKRTPGAPRDLPFERCVESAGSSMADREGAFAGTILQIGAVIAVGTVLMGCWALVRDWWKARGVCPTRRRNEYIDLSSLEDSTSGRGPGSGVQLVSKTPQATVV